MKAVEREITQAHDAYESGDLGAARARAQRALALLRRARGDDADDLRFETWMLLAAIHVEEHDAEAALAYLQRVRELAPDDGEALYYEARARLLRWELDAADDLLARCAPPPELQGCVLYERAILAELRGQHDRAEKLYEQAERLDPDSCPRPVRMDDDEARELLVELVDSFPPDVRAALDNTHIEIADVPDPKIDGVENDPLVLGLYHGVPIGDRSATPISLPDSVRIFKRNIERLASDPEQLREELRVTLLHEVGHHLGWDEHDLEERGIG